MKKITRVGVMATGLLAAVAVLSVSIPAYGQQAGPAAPCAVTKVELKIGTGGDDLRGGQNNLNVGLLFADHSVQSEENVNHSQNWPNNSVHTIVITLQHAMSAADIKEIRLYHIASGSVNANGAVAGPIGLAAGTKSPDNWDMSSVEITAAGVSWIGGIASHAAYRFTAADSSLAIATKIPDVCLQGSQGGASGSSSQASSGLTNQDVVRMAKAGVPQAAILGVIRSKPATFDLSANAKTLFDQDLGTISSTEKDALWSAMTAKSSGASQAQNSGGTGSGQMTPAHLAALTKSVHTAKGKVNPVAGNPSASGANSPTIAALTQQKQTALTERTQTGSTSSTGSNSSGGSTPAATASNGRVAMLSAPAATNITAPAAAPPARSSTTNRALMTAPRSATSGITLACTTSSAPAIQTVSGQQGNVVFMQDPAYNPFTIKGCNFGNAKGQAQLNTRSGQKLATLNIDTWTNGLITVEVDPTLTDVLDQDGVTLVVFPASGPQTQQPGFHFYAKRAEMLLTSIPASATTLAPINDDAGVPVTAKLSSPYPVSGGSVSGGVDRFDITRFVGGTDVFDFSKLKPGFVLEKYQSDQLSNAQCAEAGPTSTTFYTDGSWGWQMVGNTIQVSWQEAHCHDAMFGDQSDASYGLNVWVVGPVLSTGTSPWQDGVK